MTREEAIQRLTALQDGSGQTYEAIRIAIESLSAEPSKEQNTADTLLKSASDECKEQKSKLDLISRADAIEAVCCECEGEHYPDCLQQIYCIEVNNLLALPSADRPKGNSDEKEKSIEQFLTLLTINALSDSQVADRPKEQNKPVLEQEIYDELLRRFQDEETKAFAKPCGLKEHAVWNKAIRILEEYVDER